MALGALWCPGALLWLEGRQGGRRRGNPGGPGGGVSSGLGKTTLCDVIWVPLSEAVQSSLLPPSPPSPPGWLASQKTPPLVASGPLPRSQRLEKEKGAKKRAVKEFLFSRKGTVPRNLVNIKPKGQAQED